MNTEQNQEYKVADEMPTDPMFAPASEPPTGEAVKTMVFGILSIYLGCLPFSSIVGIVFAALARRWSVPIIENYPYTGARLFAKAGRITGNIGLPVSIAMTAFWTFYFFVLIVIGLSAAVG